MGPKTKRLNPASQPSLTQPGLNLLQSIFGTAGTGMGPSATANQRFNPILNALNKVTANPMANPPQMAPGGNVLERIGNVFGSPIQGGFDQFSGQANVNAMQPIFQRNLADALGLQRENGPRFSSGQNLLGMQTSQRALQDFNSFAEQVLQQGQATKLQAMLGAGAQQGQLLQQLLGALFTGGGVNAAPIYQQSPGLGQQLLSLGGTLGGAALGGGLFGGNRGGPQQYSGDPYHPFG